ncbi:hypothetical protein ERJ75_000804600 [Trypanosoma vivax]|nr:hypothetical protein ERJ75_000804600 [Trypanosoma vivax]
MRQPRTQVLRSDAKAVSTRVAEGNLALTTEEREEARGPRDLAKLGQGAASELLDQRANATSVARQATKQARTLAVETRGAAQAWQTGGEGPHTARARGSSGGELLGGGGEEKRRGACGGVSEPRRGTAIARRGRAAPDRAAAAKTLSATRAERNS